MTELGGAQISSLLEALPGIKSVLRSPVADAIVNTLRAAADLGEFQHKDAEELVQYAIRRSLITESEGEELLAQLRVVAGERQAAAAARAKAEKAKPAPKPPAAEAPIKAQKLARPPARPPTRPAKATKAAAKPKPKAAAARRPKRAAPKKAAPKKAAPKKTAARKPAFRKPARKR